jgi:predicted alpha/beta-hydrolase family hydrolase
MTLVTGPARGPTFLFAHGAGAPMDSRFMNVVADGLADAGVRVIRFEFPYMAARRDGARRPPDRAEALLDAFRAAARATRVRRLFVGGKSMGGRIASMVCDELGAAGLVCLGYPFWPPGRARDDARITHLRSLGTPALIVQGTRDEFGGRGEIESLGITPAIHLVEDGDHDMRPRRASGRTHAGNLAEVVDVVARFIHAARLQAGRSTPRSSAREATPTRR